MFYVLDSLCDIIPLTFSHSTIAECVTEYVQIFPNGTSVYTVRNTSKGRVADIKEVFVGDFLGVLGKSYQTTIQEHFLSEFCINVRRIYPDNSLVTGVFLV